MTDVPGHMSPPYSDEARDDALFHYTSATGLMGILQSKEIWATAYYCSNDASELSVGRGVLTPKFSEITQNMIRDGAPLARTFFSRGVSPMHYAENFEQMVIGSAFSQLSTYITCFCRPNGNEDFTHGLLSQWRAYGSDGGYALQFSRKKLRAAIEEIEKEKSWQYGLQDVFYTATNPLRDKVLDYMDAFVRAYIQHLEDLGRPLSEILDTHTLPNPIRGLFGGPIEALLSYLIYTKNGHFSEERECRLSIMDAKLPNMQTTPTHCFDRRGLIVPYKSIPRAILPLVDSIEWILIGPNSRMNARFKSVVQMVKSVGLDINVRPSYIPFVRS